MPDTAEALIWSRVSARAGRNDLPGLLFHHLHDLAPHDLVTAVTEAWTMSEWPEQHADQNSWLYAFDLAADGALIVDDEVVAREESGDLAALTDADGCVTLYRGAIESRRHGMSWTNDIEMARWFARRFDGMTDDQGKVWTITVPADYVLAILTGGRREAEVVVDTTGFEDVEYREVAR